MAAKKKSNKTGDDDWEAEVGEATAPGAAAVAPEPDEEPAAGGGLMALMRKNKDKFKGKGNVEPVAQDEQSVDITQAANVAVEASAEDEFSLPDKKAKGAMKKTPHHPLQKNQKPIDTDDDLDGDETQDGRILTKVEKDKLKKEREKARKRDQAAKKKVTVPVHTPAPPKASSQSPPSVKVPAPDTAAVNPSADATKKKKLPAHLALIQQQQEDIRRKKEEQTRLEEEERARIEAEDRKNIDDLRRKEELKALKKQKEKEKIEQLKKEGKFLTKAQREEKARNEVKLQQMREAGIVISDFKEGQTAEDRKKSAMEKAKRVKKIETKVDEDKVLREAAERATIQAEKAAKAAVETAVRERAAAEERRAAEAEAAAAEVIDDDWELAAEERDGGVSSATESEDDGSAEESAASTPVRRGAASTVPSSATAAGEEGPDTKRRLADTVAAPSSRSAAEKEKAAEKREKAHQAALAARSKDDLRSPICCILGHVDTGKTKLLDKIRQTNVQEGEAGGITQQIGATYFPLDAIMQKTAVVNKDGKFEFKVPGLLIIDTPGHESFANLRSRGSSLCNIAILVVDIMHGLEPQTLESMKLLRDRKTPFIVALNKIDRLYGWEKVDNNGFQASLAVQNKAVQNEFKTRLDKTKLEFAEQGFNSELFYENKSMARYVSLVPTSAHTGEGIPDMLKLILQLTQERMVGSLMYLSEVQATVLEVKATEGIGMTIDVILSNGILREGDRIILCGMSGIIKTNIRALLTPAPMRELRIRSMYVHNKEVKAALGVKISAPGLDDAIAGSRLMVLGPDEDEADVEDELLSDLASLFSRVEKTGRGVSVQASTLGSLEALLDFLRDCKIPVANVGIGPVYKRDVIQCSTMLERAPDYCVMLCFDVKIDREAQAYADEHHIKIFVADIIYHLFDAFTSHMTQLLEKKKENSKLMAVFPCVLNPVAVFNKTGPIIIGVDVVEGQLKLDTPIAVVKTNPTTNVKETIGIGRVTSIERDHKQIQVCKKGQPSVAVKIEMGSHQPAYGRQLEEKDVLYSQISRASIDCLKEFYRKDVSNDEWQLIVKLKPLFNII